VLPGASPLAGLDYHGQLFVDWSNGWESSGAEGYDLCLELKAYKIGSPLSHSDIISIS
jgi:hypothetical protein